MPEERVLEEIILAPHAVKRLIEPDEVADVVAFLLDARRAHVHRRGGHDGPGLDGALRNAATPRSAAGSSVTYRCAAPGHSASSAPGIAAASRSPFSGGISTSSAPWTTSVGARIRSTAASCACAAASWAA